MWVETQPSAQSSFRKLNVDNSFQKTRKIRYHIFEVLSNFTVYFHYVPNILARIIEKIELTQVALKKSWRTHKKQ